MPRQSRPIEVQPATAKRPARTAPKSAAVPKSAAAPAAPTAGSPVSLDRHLGQAIRAARLRDRLTIAEVAERAGVSGGMLSKIENAQVSASLDSLQRIANALGLPMSSLFRDFDAKAGGAVLAYGSFINNVIEFLIIAFSIFLVVRQINKWRSAPAKS